MTIIVAAETSTGIAVAADTQTTDGSLRAYGVESKLHVAGPYVLGVAGSKRVGQVIKHGTAWPALPEALGAERGEVLAFLVNTVVPAIQEACRNAGVLHDDNGVASFDAVILLVVAGVIAEVDSDGCVHIDRSGRWAIGSGGQVALGYLGDTGPWEPHDVIEAAMRAVRVDLGCGGGVDVLTVPTDPDTPCEQL